MFISEYAEIRSWSEQVSCYVTSPIRSCNLDRKPPQADYADMLKRHRQLNSAIRVLSAVV